MTVARFSLFALLLTGCGSNNSTVVQSNLASADYALEVRLGVSENVGGTVSEAYTVAASSNVALKDGTAKICLGSKADCKAGTATTYDTDKFSRSDRDVYATKNPIQLKSGDQITFIGIDESGSEVIESFQLKSVGAESPCYKAPDEFTCEVELAIAKYTNEFRVKQGRSELQYDPKMSYVSRLWSTEQARVGNISHAWFSNGRWQQEYRKEFGVSANLSAENVAMNSGFSSDSAEAVAKRFVNQWINSSGHRVNMLANHKAIGTGVAKRGQSWYGTQNFGR